MRTAVRPAPLLLVDDDPAVRTALKFALELDGYEVETFADAESLAACPQLPADGCLVVDLQLPGMDGLEETRRIRAMDRADAKTVPIIALTANLFRQDMTACTDAGMTGFLSKPLNVGQLLKMISQQTKKGEDNDE